jgi:thiamine-phosphate pyrophosphorylase
MTQTKTKLDDAHSARQRVRGLYALTPDTPDTDRLVQLVDQAISGGARMVQYRNKSARSELRREQAQRLIMLCGARGVPLIINDDIELAAATSADGVHLGREDASLDEARAALGGTALVGVSCYNELAIALAAEQAGASYVAFGSFFQSSVKPTAVHASIDLLYRARASLALPIVAIGGVTSQNAQFLVAAGADAVAVISALFDAPDVAAAARAFAPVFAAFPQPAQLT